MSANIEFPEETAGSIPNASAPDRKRLFLDQADGSFKTKDNAGLVEPLAPGATVAWVHNPVVTNPPYNNGGSPYTAVSQETVKVNPAGGAIRVNLPTAVAIAGVQIKVISLSDSLSPNNIEVYPDGAETINGDPFKLLTTPRERITVESDGANWLVVD